MSNKIESIINSSDISSVSNPLSGDCASVAKALVDYFDASFLCLYSTKNNTANELPAHVLVEIDGDLYDGSGQLTRRDAFEIHLVLNGELDGEEYSSEYFISESPPEYMISDEVVDSVLSELRDT